MKVLAIDLGSYSVKFVEYQTDKKTLHIENCSEVVIGQLKDQFHPDTPILDVQLEIIEGYLNHKHYDGKIVYQIPRSYLTTRFLKIPIKNKKKAELMIPFQLEESIPLPPHNCHIVSELFENNNSMDAIVYIANLEAFENLYNELGEREILPALLSPESSFIQHYLTSKNMKDEICVLDIGHDTSKAYYFSNGKLSSAHVGNVAGKSITEVIAQTYQLPTNEATIYKHENCFFLTQNQYNEVDEDQRDFAQIMKQGISPLVLDLKRWNLGHRINHGKSIERVYLMGGTSQIKNFKNFLSQAIEIEVEVLNLDYLLEIKNPAFKMAENNPRFLMSHIMGAGQLAKDLPANLLTTQYSSGFTENIPLHSTGFIAARVIVFSFILFIGLLCENIILKKRSKKVSKTLATIVKRSKDLNFTRKQTRSIKKNKNLPKMIKTLKKKNKNIEEMLKLLTTSGRVNALQFLEEITSLSPKNSDVDLIKFESADDTVSATFSSLDTAHLNELKTLFNQSTLLDKEVSLSKKDNTLTLLFKGSHSL